MKIYKYRGGSRETVSRDLKALEENYFWSPTVDQLNDPSEAYVNDIEMRQFLRSLELQQVESSFNNFVKMRHTVGVYSLSKTPFDELMWAYYSDGHRGFCIEYDLDRLVLEARSGWNIVEVSYRNEPQTISLSDIWPPGKQEAVLSKMIGTKSIRWGHEKEVRIVTSKSGVNYYAPSALTGIYFGYRSDDELICKIRRLLKGRGVQYYRMRFADDLYEMRSNTLEYEIEIDGQMNEYEAPIDEAIFPDLKYVKESNRPFYKYLERAVDVVRRDSSCNKVLLVEFSVYKNKDSKPVIFVTYETNVQTGYANILNRYFSVSELDEEKLGH